MKMKMIKNPDNECIEMKVAVGAINMMYKRNLYRGGGLDGTSNSGSTDYISTNKNVSSCEAFCYSVMKAGGLGATPYISDPYFVKCFDVYTSTPLNGRTIAFASQIGTTGVDPSLPSISNLTDTSLCKRIIFIYSQIDGYILLCILN